MRSTYTGNGKVQTATDGENNKTTCEDDGHDRLARTLFPSPTKGAGTSNANDFEQLGYDPASNVTSRRLRDGQVISYTFDALNRTRLKDLPGTEPDVTYEHDNLGRLKSATQNGKTLSFTYDALGRNRSQTSGWGTMQSDYDLAGRRTRIVHPDGFSVFQNYLVTGTIPGTQYLIRSRGCRGCSWQPLLCSLGAGPWQDDQRPDAGLRLQSGKPQRFRGHNTQLEAEAVAVARGSLFFIAQCRTLAERPTA